MCSSAILIAGTLPDELKPNRPNEVMSANSRVSTATAASNAANKKSIARRDIAAASYTGCFDHRYYDRYLRKVYITHGIHYFIACARYTQEAWSIN